MSVKGAVMVRTVLLITTFFILTFAETVFCSPFRNIKEGYSVPSAFVFDLCTGKKLDIKTLADGGVAVFLFWGADSPYKRKHSFRAIKRLAELKNLNFRFYPVNVQGDDSSLIKDLLEKAGYKGPCLTDESRKAYGALGIFVMPSVLITKDGKVFKAIGYTHGFANVVKLYVELALGLKTQKEVYAELHPKQDELPPGEREALRYYQLGLNMVRKGMPSRAEDAFRKAIKASGNFTKAYFGLSLVLLQEKEVKNATEELSRVIGFLEEIAPSDYRTQLIKARFLIKEGKVREALDIANTLLFTKPRCPDVYILLGDIYSSMGDFKKANHYYKKALDELYNPYRILEE